MQKTFFGLAAALVTLELSFNAATAATSQNCSSATITKVASGVHVVCNAVATPSPLPTIKPTPVPTPVPTLVPTPVPTPSPFGKVLWVAGGDVNLGRWINANTFQCGSPVQDGASFTFSLRYAADGSCGRNQAQPIDPVTNDVLRLQVDHQATFSFHYIDGKPDGSGPGMGYDKDARSLVWQMHPYGGGGPQCGIGLLLSNGGQIGGAQVWQINNCNGVIWTGDYTPGEVDDWIIVVGVSPTSKGYLQLYRNGTQVASASGATFGGGNGDPWFNFGPYKWRWDSDTSPICCSSMVEVNATIQNMRVTQE
ncbi:MAG: hypothetical protein NVS3B3_09270 [Aquirhabdus sp.]